MTYLVLTVRSLLESVMTFNAGMSKDMRCRSILFRYRQYSEHLFIQHKPPVPSSDLLGKGGSRKQAAVRRYIFAAELQAKYLDCLLKLNAPREYATLKRSAKAGRWYTECNGGCFLGLATVWKCQVGVHLDQKDWELCVITCGGNYTGGNLYLPDLNLCLA